MSVDGAILSIVTNKPLLFNDLQRMGISDDYFTDEYQRAWKWITKVKAKHGKIPSKAALESRFPNLEFDRAKQRDLPVLVQDIRQRHKFISLMNALDEASREADDPDDVDRVLASLQGKLTSLSVRHGDSSIVDLFERSTKRRMMKDLKRRRSGEMVGIPTGLKRFDYITGGLVKQKMIVVMARTGVGKSWLNLLFVASAILNGQKVVLYPLEMTLEETALRLYTIFSQKMMGPSKAIKNLDLTMGRFTPKKIRILMDALEDQYAGQLYVADIGSIADPYTIERVEAEVEIYKPDLFWVDYLTLMKSPSGRQGTEDYTSIKALSAGIKGIAQRQHTVGGCSAQVNRESMKVKSFLPRLEHIAYGDSIGHDADQVISLAKKDEYLYYGLVKNRGGPEIGKTRLKFFVDSGIIEETEQQDEEEDE